MGGNFQQHQGVEFNNPDGTPVQAIGSGTVVYAGPAEEGALTVTIRHDTTATAQGKRYRLYSTYYHNSALIAKLGRKVVKGAVIARVGNTGRATNDHLHLEISASPVDSIGAIVDSLQRFPPYTTNPELWIEPLPNTGIVAGQGFDRGGAPGAQGGGAGPAGPDLRHHQARPGGHSLFLRRDLWRQGALAPVVRRALRRQRRAAGDLRDGHRDQRQEGVPAGGSRTRQAHMGSV